MELKLNTKRTFLVSLAFMSIMLFWSTYDTIVAKLLVENFGLNQTYSGAIMALDNVLALFMLPLFGRFSDKTKTKWGKRTPYIVIGTMVAAILIVAASFFDLYQQQAVLNFGFSGVISAEGDNARFTYLLNGVEQGLFDSKSLATTNRSAAIFKEVTMASPGLFIGFIITLFFVLLAMGTYRSPAVSLMPDVTPKPVRSKANSIVNLLGTIGGAISYILVFVIGVIPGVKENLLSNLLVFVFTAALMVIFIVFFVIKVKENEWVQEMADITKLHNLDHIQIDEEGVDVSTYTTDQKMPKEIRRSFILILTAVVLWFMGYNAATTKFSVYASNHLDLDSFSIPPLVATISAAIAFIPIGYISQKLGRRKVILFGIGLLAVSLLSGAFVTSDTKVLMYVIMALVGISWASINVNSYPMVVEMSKHGNIGTYTGYYYTASMSAMIVTPILSGMLLDLTGIYPLLFIYSAAFVALAFIPMFFVKHGEPVSVFFEDKK